MLLEFTINLSSSPDKLKRIILDYEKLPMFLPDQLKKIEIIKKDEQEVVTEETFLFSTIFKKTIQQKSSHKILSDEHFHTDIIEGITKDSTLDIFFVSIDTGTKLTIKANLKLGFKYKIFQPIIKKYYKMILTGILYKINNKALDRI
jgi:ribosome-associated toxin RatA of RatAB toxin-antitoxin module